MNIAQIKQLQTTDGWIDCSGQIKEIKEIKQRTKSNLSKTPGQKYNVQKLVVQDDTDTISLWAYANQQFMSGQIVSIHGMVKEYQGKRYLDYCDIKTDPNTSQNTQQTPPQPAQATNYQPPAPQGKKEPDWDAKDLRMARMNALTNSTKLVCLMLEAGETKPPDVALIAKTAEMIVNYIYKGLPSLTKPEQQQANSNVELCGDCGQPRPCDCIPF